MGDRDLCNFASTTQSMTDVLLASYVARKGFDIQPEDNQFVAHGPALAALGMWRRSTNFIEKCTITIEAAGATHVGAESPLNSLTCIPSAHPTGHLSA